MKVADITKGPIEGIADDSAVVFASCVLEYVTDAAAALRELARIAGSPENLFLVLVEPWTLTATLYPGARWAGIANLAGLPWHGTHVLRKTCGTRIADGGGGVAAVAAHLRHKDLQTASRYIDRRGASSRAINALET